MMRLLRQILFRIYKYLPAALRWRISYALSRKFLVGMLFFIERERGLLLVRHTYQKAWTLPGGWLNHHETIADGARREIREEFGVEATGIRIATVQAAATRPVIDIAVACELVGTPVADRSEIASFAFFKFHELPADIVKSHRVYIEEHFRSHP